MDIFDVLTLIGGLALFLFGMNLMGQALERRAGDSLRSILGKFTTKKSAGFLTGLGVTAVIQSSSATTVMVVGFVNSGLLTLSQAINVIMGANVGTTVTAWILSLSGIEGGNVFTELLKPTSFTPILALIGIIYTMFCKSSKKQDTGMILLGFATLMFGMDTMSGAVAGLKEVEGFRNILLLFTNPILGVLAGAVLTAVIQSSSASVGILQALASTGQVTLGAAIPIIMGQNIGTCVTAMLSSVGTNKGARRAALVHLSFNVLGTVVWVIIFWIIKATLAPAILAIAADELNIAIVHSAFNVLCTALLLPMTGLLEKIAYILIPEDRAPEVVEELDERLLTTPAVALERCHAVAADMAHCAVDTLHKAIAGLYAYTPELEAEVRAGENRSDHYEDILGSYLVKLSALQISDNASAEAAMLLKIIGDFERISDHGVEIIASAQEIRQKNLSFSPAGEIEIRKITAAVEEILDLSLAAFIENDSDAIFNVEPLEQIIDELKNTLRSNHIRRLQQGECTIDVGFVWSDLLTSLERTSDHCSNIAGGVLDFANHNMNMHENLHALKADNTAFDQRVMQYREKYALKA